MGNSTLDPLGELAEQVHASIAAVRQYKKAPGINALDAGGGSVGFSAAVRAVVAMLPDPDDDTDTQFLFAVAKSNLVTPGERPAFRYEIVSSNYDHEIGRIAWGDMVDRSANDTLQALAKREGHKVTASNASGWFSL